MVDVEDDHQSLVNGLKGIEGGTDDESAEEDCSAHPEALTLVLFGSEGADCKGKDEKAISEGDACP